MAKGVAQFGMQEMAYEYAFDTEVKYSYLLPNTADGVVSYNLEVTVARNAVVRQYLLEVQARHANETLLQNVAQARTTSRVEESVDLTTATIDFGTPRTVSGIKVPAGLKIYRVYTWNGSAFSNSAAYAATRDDADVDPPSGSTTNRAIFSEVRSERLKVELVGETDAAALGSGTTLHLPEAPSDLELRIDGGAPVWTHPGPVKPGTDAKLELNAWSSEGRTLVDLTDVLAARTGDPTASGDLTLQLALTSRVPGVLKLAESSRKTSVIRRVLFNGDTARELSFDAEGRQELPLEGIITSGKRKVEEIRLSVVGKPAPERTLPPVGPTAKQNDPAQNDGVAEPLIELLLDTQHAAAMRLPVDLFQQKWEGVPAPVLSERVGTTLGRIKQLSGVRLPLRSGGSGAEARVVVWSSGPDGEPIEVLKGGTSLPVELEPGAAVDPPWTLFAFDKPVQIDAASPPWAVVVVTRGAVTWALGSIPLAAATGDNGLRRGPPNGPWLKLPGAFQTGDFRHLRGRMRLVGLPAPETPIVPVTLSVSGGGDVVVGVTPTPKGVSSALSFGAGVELASLVLQLTSRVAGNVTVRDIDVTSTT